MTQSAPHPPHLILTLRSRPLAAVLLLLAIAVGVALRLDQFTQQVLIDDEWHAVHRIISRTPAQMFLDFGFADYSIPLGILGWHEARWFGLSETGMRLPMLLCGLATLVLFPLCIVRRFDAATAAIYAALLAISPLLFIYSRMARPYAITLLLAWVAQFAFRRYCESPGRRGAAAGALYVSTSALAVWLHPIVGPFVLAPFAWALARLARAPAGGRRRHFLRLAALAVPAAVAIGALVLPPMLANPHSLANKSGVDTPNVGTLVGVWFAWLGTPSSAIVAVLVAVAATGAGEVWRRLPEARPAVLGTLLTLGALFLGRPAWIFNPIALARYLLPFAPLLLLAVAVGAVRIARKIDGASPARRVLSAVALIAPVALLAVQSPLRELVRHPNLETVHLRYHLDFRPGRNAYLPFQKGIPLSPFWSQLAQQGAGSVTVAAAPFYFESYDWDAPRWEAIGRQPVIPGYLTGLCVDQRSGELPRDPLYRFRNAVHLVDDAALAARGVRYVVWQKPYTRIVDGRAVVNGEATAHCEAALRAKFGTPVFEDSALVAFRLPAPAGARATGHAAQ